MRQAKPLTRPASVIRTTVNTGTSSACNLVQDYAPEAIPARRNVEQSHAGNASIRCSAWPCLAVTSKTRWNGAYLQLHFRFLSDACTSSHMLDDLSAVKCSVKVERDLASCEHKVLLPCSSDVSKHRCESLCDGVLACCGNQCTAKCHMCQDDVNAQVRKPRIRHKSHVCGRPLFCQHPCTGTCSADHKCLDACKALCRQKCSHTSCAKKCSDPCVPCQEPCAWYEPADSGARGH